MSRSGLKVEGGGQGPGAFKRHVIWDLQFYTGHIFYSSIKL